MFFGSVQIISPLDSQSKSQMFTLFSDRHAERLRIPSIWRLYTPGEEGGYSLMKWAGMLVGNFELNPFRRPIWAWSTPLLTPNRDHVRKQTNIYFYIFSCATLNETFTAKYNGVLPRAPSGDQNQKFTLLSETTSIPTPFICESLTPLPRLHPSLYNFRAEHFDKIS